MTLSVFYTSAFKFYIVQFYEGLKRDFHRVMTESHSRAGIANVVFLLCLSVAIGAVIEWSPLKRSFLIPSVVAVLSYVAFPSYLLYLNASIYREDTVFISVVGVAAASSALVWFYVACMLASSNEYYLYTVPLFYSLVANWCFWRRYRVI